MNCHLINYKVGPIYPLNRSIGAAQFSESKELDGVHWKIQDTRELAGTRPYLLERLDTVNCDSIFYIDSKTRKLLGQEINMGVRKMFMELSAD